LHKKLAKEQKQILRNQSNKMEQYTASLFKKAGFNAIASLEYKDDNQTGEIDTIAYKDNTLFICELKTTYLQEDISATNKYEILRFELKASSQLAKAKKYTLNNFKELKKNKELAIDCNENELRIVTIIMSNIYQSDNLIFKEHLKISLFELMIILQNDLKKMIELNMKLFFGEDFNLPIDTLQKTHNKYNKDYKHHNNAKTKSYDLWSNQNSCSAANLITSITENKVWEHLEKNKYYLKNSIEINTDYSKKILLLITLTVKFPGLVSMV